MSLKMKITIRKKGEVKRVDFHYFKQVLEKDGWKPTSKKLLKRFINSELSIVRNLYHLEQQGYSMSADFSKTCHAKDKIIPNKGGMILQRYMRTIINTDKIRSQIEANFPITEWEKVASEVKQGGKYEIIFNNACTDNFQRRKISYIL